MNIYLYFFFLNYNNTTQKGITQIKTVHKFSQDLEDFGKQHSCYCFNDICSATKNS